MAIPIILGVGAALAAAGGIGAGIKGAVDTKDAKDTMDAATRRNEKNLDNFKSAEKSTNTRMEDLGKLEMTTANDFKRFSNAFEKIDNKPTFSPLKDNVKIPSFDFNAIKSVSVAAEAFFGASFGVTAGLAAGTVFRSVAAAGTTPTIMALGTALPGTTIASLSGAAATNAALMAIGGGSLAAGGGGMALGATILSASTLGVGLLVGGAIFAFTGSKIKEKADDAYTAMLKNEDIINKNIEYLYRIRSAIADLSFAIRRVSGIYDKNVVRFIQLVDQKGDYNHYNSAEKLLCENIIRIVSVLYKLINTPLLKVTKTDNQGKPLETELDAESVKTAIANTFSVLSESGIEIV